MNIFHAIIGLLLVFGLAGVGYLSQFGLFAPIEVREEAAGPFVLVSTKHVGDYKNTAQVMDALYDDLTENHGLAPTKGFGLYFDKPGEVETTALRSIVGSIVEEKSLDELNNLREKYGVIEYPSTQSVTVTFPYRGTLSIIIGVMRVYPKLAAHIDKHSHPATPIMEIYDQPNQVIRYISSIALPADYFSQLWETEIAN